MTNFGIIILKQKPKKQEYIPRRSALSCLHPQTEISQISPITSCRAAGLRTALTVNEHGGKLISTTLFLINSWSAPSPSKLLNTNAAQNSHLLCSWGLCGEELHSDNKSLFTFCHPFTNTQIPSTSLEADVLSAVLPAASIFTIGYADLTARWWNERTNIIIKLLLPDRITILWSAAAPPPPFLIL